MLWQDNHFSPCPSDAFHSYFNGNKEYERRIIQILVTRSFDLVSGNRDGFSKTVFDRKWWKQQHKRKQAEQKLLLQLGAENHAFLASGESRTSSVRREKLSNEIYCTINARGVLLSVDFVTYVSISEVLVKTY